MELKKTAKEKLTGFIPSKHIAKWKLIAEGALAVIIIVGLFEIAHYVFYVKFSEEFLVFLELADYSAIFILGIDLMHHFSTSENKPKFLQNKFIYILSFIPYLVFTKTMGALYLLKPIFTGIAKIIKLFSHKKEIKERVEHVHEELTGKKKIKKRTELFLLFFQVFCC